MVGPGTGQFASMSRAVAAASNSTARGGKQGVAVQPFVGMFLVRGCGMWRGRDALATTPLLTSRACRAGYSGACSEVRCSRQVVIQRCGSGCQRGRGQRFIVIGTEGSHQSSGLFGEKLDRIGPRYRV